MSLHRSLNTKYGMCTCSQKIQKAKQMFHYRSYNITHTLASDLESVACLCVSPYKACLSNRLLFFSFFISCIVATSHTFLWVSLLLSINPSTLIFWMHLIPLISMGSSVIEMCYVWPCAYIYTHTLTTGAVSPISSCLIYNSQSRAQE